MCANVNSAEQDSLWSGGKVSEYAYCIKANNPTPMTYVGTNTWLLFEPETRAAYVVDPGPLMEDHLAAIESFIEAQKLSVEAILLTHMHLDHSEAAQELAQHLGVEVYSREAGTLDDGELVIGDGPQLVVVSLPGHSSDSVGFCFPADESIISGDVVFLQSPTAIVSPDGSLKDYFETLNKLKLLVEQEGYKRFLTAHGWFIEDPLAVIGNTEAHRLSRLASVRGAITRKEEVDIDYILESVYDDIDTRLDPAARMNVIAQVDYLKAINDPCIPR
ncbi:MAG: MBL fold metallo-hydrolase [Raoultibacter sp.]|jgi:glyoxylase-like metal-dependent hydrolase (beta-lactamase superfamily II)